MAGVVNIPWYVTLFRGDAFDAYSMCGAKYPSVL